MDTTSHFGERRTDRIDVHVHMVGNGFAGSGGWLRLKGWHRWLAGFMLRQLGIPASALRQYKRAPAKAHVGGFYIALELYDRPGSVAAIAHILAEEKISIASIVQRAPRSPEEKRAIAPFILITHDTLELSMRAALQRIEQDGLAASKPRMIRIERF